MGFRLAELFVDIQANDKPALGAINRVRGAFSSLGSRVAGLAGGLAIGAFITKSIREAADLAESVDFAKIVFKDSYPEIEEFSSQLQKAFGIGRRASLDMAVGVAGIGKNLGGLAGGELADFAKATSMLAIDMASAMNLSDEEAGRAIAITLAGNQSDLMRQKGVNILDEHVTARGVKEGVIEKGGKLTEQQKLALRLIMLEEQLADTIGNRAMTADSAVNQQKAAFGQLNEAYVTFGGAIMPIWTGLLQAAGSALGGINEWLSSSADGVTSWAETIGGWLNAVGVMFRHWDISVQIVALAFGQRMTNVQEWAAWAFGALGQYGDWFAANWVNLIRDALMGVWTIFRNIFDNIVNLVRAAWNYITNPAGGFTFEFKPLLDGFEAATAKLPEIAAPHLSNFQSQIDELTTKMSDAEAKVAGGSLAPDTKGVGEIGRDMLAKAAADEAAAAGTAAAEKARTSTLEGFAKNLLESAFSKDKGLKAQEETAKNTAKMAEALMGGAGALGPIVGVAG